VELARAAWQRNSKNCSAEPKRSFGGAGRDRTDDLLLAKQALSQLSYSPLKFIAKFKAAKTF
jgi:hypothetical protein